MTDIDLEREGSEFYEYPDVTIEYRDASHRYWLLHGDQRIPAVSVTTALKVLDKPALLKWAEAAGAEGAAKLFAAGELADVHPSRAIDVVRINKMGMDATRDSGASRGTAVQPVREQWASDGPGPTLDAFPADVRGYVQGLCSWLLEAQPQPSSVERFVGSVAHSYAGRMDMRAVIDGRDCIVDLKTNPKGAVYDEAHLQARAYALAEVECGNPEPEGLVIVAVGEEGNYSTTESDADATDWLNVLACFRSMKRLEQLRNARWREAQKAAA